MTIYICYYDRKSDNSPDCYKEHKTQIDGKNAKECMDKYTEFLTYFDYLKYAMPEIYNITD